MRIAAGLLLCAIGSTASHAGGRGDGRGGRGAPSSFTSGDLYLVSSALPAGNGQPGNWPGAMHIDPMTGVATRLPFAQQFMQGRATYDPFRDRIIATHLSEPPVMIDAAGGVQSLPMSTPLIARCVAPTGCGRLYLLHTSTLSVVVSDGTTFTVMNEAGTQPLMLSIAPGGVTMIFDATNNCLLLADPHGINLLRVQRLTLSSDGLRASGAIASNAVDVIAGETEIPVGFSAGPGGQAFLKLDDNSGFAFPRMVLVHPQTLAITPYAFSGYFGVGGEVAGCYSSVRDQAVVLDSLNDVLRVFNLNQSGAGAAFATGVSPSGSGELAQLIEIGGTINNPIVCPSPPPCPADINDDGAINVTDLLAVISAWGATGANQADVNDDGVINVTDLLTVISAWGTCP